MGPTTTEGNDMDYKVINTSDLITLNHKAHRQEFNRVLDPHRVRALADPDGTHILRMVMYGHNMDTAAVLHHRAEVLIKVRNTMTPERAYIDIAAKDWDRLTDAEVPEHDEAS
jgi:hypothetical protein